MGPLGASSGPLGRLLGRLGGLLGPLWALLGLLLALGGSKRVSEAVWARFGLHFLTFLEAWTLKKLRFSCGKMRFFMKLRVLLKISILAAFVLQFGGLGALLEPLGPPFWLLGTLLGRFWALLGRSWDASGTPLGPKERPRGPQEALKRDSGLFGGSFWVP